MSARRAAALACLLAGCGGVAAAGPIAPRDAPAVATGPEARVELVEFMGAPDGRVQLLRVTLPPGASRPFRVSRCQDVLVRVLSGAVSFVRDGFYEELERGSLGEHAAARLASDTSTSVHLSNPEADTTAQLLVARVRALAPGAAPADDWDTPSTRDDCPAAPAPNPWGAAATEGGTPALAVAGGKLRVTILLDETSSGGKLGALSLLDGDADLRVPEHTHPGAAEVLYIESGSGHMKIADREIEIRAPMVVYVPADTVHDLRADGSAPLHAVQIYSPAGPEQRFRALAQATQATQAAPTTQPMQSTQPTQPTQGLPSP